MYKLLLLSVIQSILLVCGQTFLKLSLNEVVGKFSFTWQYFKQYLFSLKFFLCGLSFGAATILWFYIIKHFPLNMAYPLISLSFVFGMVAAIFVFHEEVPAIRYIGLVLIIIGTILIVHK